ncbi:MAG: PAS domain S-box protein [Proteobacteria bacterium]|nr:PAS domain S-box protein [Pseudomonadota bacterium]
MMEDKAKTKRQLIMELAKLRQRTHELESAEIRRGQAKEMFDPDGRSESAGEVEIQLQNGSAKSTEMSARPIQKDNQSPDTILGKNLLGGSLAPRVIVHSDALLSSLLEESPIAIALFDSDGHLVTANRSCAEMFGTDEYTDYSMLGWSGLFDDPYLPDKVKRRLRQGKATRYEYKVPFGLEEGKRLGLYKTRNSLLLWLNVVVSPVMDNEGDKPVAYVQQMEDITALKRSHQELRDLSRRLVEVQEVDRRNLAHELHDEIGQTLTGTRILIEMAAASGQANPNVYLKEAEAVIDDLMALVRNLTLDLRPPMLDDCASSAKVGQIGPIIRGHFQGLGLAP